MYQEFSSETVVLVCGAALRAMNHRTSLAQQHVTSKSRPHVVHRVPLVSYLPELYDTKGTIQESAHVVPALVCEGGTTQYDIIARSPRARSFRSHPPPSAAHAASSPPRTVPSRLAAGVTLTCSAVTLPSPPRSRRMFTVPPPSTGRSRPRRTTRGASRRRSSSPSRLSARDRPGPERRR